MNETVKQFVDRVWGKCTAEQRKGLLYQCTAFPFVDAARLEEQLKKVKINSGGDYDLAMKQADEIIDKAMKNCESEE